jgi:hypothetical protein
MQQCQRGLLAALALCLNDRHIIQADKTFTGLWQHLGGMREASTTRKLKEERDRIETLYLSNQVCKFKYNNIE